MGKNNKKYTLDEVREIVESKGFNLLENIYKGKRSHMSVFDNEGYFYYTTLYQIMEGSPLRVHKANIYSTKNIGKWLLDNKKPIKILSKEYSGTNRTKLLWKCLNKKCEKNFEMSWERMLDSGSCVHCSSKFANDFNNLEYLYPELSKQWHKTKNGSLKPRHFTGHNSSVKVWWQCEISKKHEWQSTISNRHTRGCPYCSGKIAYEDYNLYLNYPEICEEWDYYKNSKHPSEYTPHSNYKVWWKCKKCNHEWRTTVASRTSTGCGCTACAGQCVNEFNSLATKNSELSKEWNYEKNKNTTPKDITWGSNKNIWWKCKKCNHEWRMTPAARNRGRGCPRCNISIGENAVCKILNKYNVKNIPQYKFDDCKNINHLHFDFFLPKYKKTIEVNGKQHYQPIAFFGGEEKFKYQQKIDQIKRDYCKKNNIKLIEIPYWDFDNIEEILVRELDLNK